MTNVASIIPKHRPQAMLLDCMEQAKGAIAGCVVLLDEDGTLHWETAGDARKDVLWALKLAEKKILELG